MSKPKAMTPEGAAVGNWRGYTRYQCTACAFDTLSLATFEDHYRNAHGSLESHTDDKPAHVEVAPLPVETLAED